MLEQIQVRNFRSLKDFTLDLRSRNIFIGPNKSGKTTVLDAFRFIAHSIGWGDVARALDERGGFGTVIWKGPRGLSAALGPGLNIEFQLFGTALADADFRYHYLLTISADVAGRAFIKRERLAMSHGDKTYNLIEMEDGGGIARRLDGTQVFADPPNRKKPALAYEIPGWEAGLVRNEIAQWHFYDLIPQMAVNSTNVSVAVGALDVNGTNLSSWIHTIQANHPETFERIERLFIDAFPEVESLRALVTPAGTTFLTSREKHLTSPVSIFHLATGELKFLMLLSLIHSPFGFPLLCIEEPENHLHPRLLSLLVETANQRRLELDGQTSQTLVTTHSPYLVDLLEPEDIVLVEKRAGETKCTRAQSGDDLRRLMREAETTLGRLWLTGSLEGR